MNAKTVNAYKEAISKAAGRIIEVMMMTAPTKPAWAEIPSYEEFRINPERAFDEVYAAAYGAYRAYQSRQPVLAARRANDAERISGAVIHFSQQIRGERHFLVEGKSAAFGYAAEFFGEAAKQYIADFSPTEEWAKKVMTLAIHAMACNAQANEGASAFNRACDEERVAQRADLVVLLANN